jgi:putative aldouronate transport system substrate-binding protein
MKAMFDRYQRRMYPDWSDPTVISPTDQKKGTQLLENTLADTVNGVVINNKLTKDDWQAAVHRWESGGGSKIVAERNRMQKDKSKPDYLK